METDEYELKVKVEGAMQYDDGIFEYYFIRHVGCCGRKNVSAKY